MTEHGTTDDRAPAATDGQVPAARPGLDGPLADALVGTRRFFTRGEVSADRRTLHREGGRVRRRVLPRPVEPRQGRPLHPRGQLHGVVLVEGLRQGRDHHLGGPADRLPDAPARTAPSTSRAAARGGRPSPGTRTRPTRVRYPYVRGVLVEMFREAKARLGDPVLAWAEIVQDPEKARRYKSARGKGGLVRATWAEATEIIAAAQVYTIKRWGPDRIAGFSPIPAMSMVSHAAGSRFTTPHRRLHAQLLRLVRRPSGGLPAGLRRPDRRTRVGGLVGRGIPDHVGQQRPPHPHPGRPLDDRGQVPRPEGRRHEPRLRRERQVRRRVAARGPGHRRGARHGDGTRRPQGVLRRPAGRLLRELRPHLHRPALPRRPRGGRRRASPTGQVPRRGRPRRTGEHLGERDVQAGAVGRGDRRSRRPRRLARPPVRRRGDRPVEPRPR